MREPSSIADEVNKMMYSGLAVVALASIAGLAGTLAGYQAESRALLLAALILLFLLPLIRVIGETATEVRRGAWLFVLAGLAVIALLAVESARALGLGPLGPSALP